MRQTGIVEKGWGHEHIWVTNDMYCSKFMYFNEGAHFSMHFHAKKEETWYVMDGKFKLEFINTENAQITTLYLYPGDQWHNRALVPHKLTALANGTILEVSTPDSVEDNYRVMPGNTQEALKFPDLK